MVDLLGLKEFTKIHPNINKNPKLVNFHRCSESSERELIMSILFDWGAPLDH